MQKIKTYQPTEKIYETIGIVIIKTIKTLNPSFSLPRHHHHKGSDCSSKSDADLTITAMPGSHQTMPSASRRRLQVSSPCALAGGAAGRALLLRVVAGLQRALLAACTASRALLAAARACWQHVLLAARCLLLVAAVKIFGLRRFDLENPRLIYKFPRPILAYKISIIVK